MRIVEVAPNSDLLDAVIALGDKNSNTLGILAASIYEDYAAKGWIIAALENDNLAGYIIYYHAKTKDWYSIQHFCIASAYRGKNVSNFLFEELKERSKAARWIRLSCRNDYHHAIELWKRLGFTPYDIVKGRATTKNTFKTIWLYPQQQQDQTLFDALISTKIAVVIDACIFYDFDAQNPTPVERESLSLLQDWLFPEVEILITPELKHEIYRHENDYVRKEYLNKARNYPETNATREEFEEALEKVLEIMPVLHEPNDRSDANQIAWAVSDNDVNVFVTRDDRILKYSEEIFEEFGLLVQRPIDLLLSIDERIRLEEYRLMRFAGTSFILRRVQQGEQDALANAFQYDHVGEKKSGFLNYLREYLLDRENLISYVVENQAGSYFALFIYDISKENELEIPLFRINSKLANSTLVRYIALQFIRECIKLNRNLLHITEPQIHKIIEDTLRQDTFYKSSKGWVKVVLPLFADSQRIADKFENVLEKDSDARDYFKFHINILRDTRNIQNTEAMATIERLILPGIIADAEIATLSIPILPVWAGRWFDESLARQTLLGASQDRAFNREGVYYSGTKRNVDLPARVIWYVTKEERIKGSQSIRAISRLDNIITGKARDLFKQFSTLGIYEISDLKRQFGSLDKEITAYRFSDTVLFPNPVSIEEWSTIREEIIGKKPPIYSPTPMNREVFREIYNRGMKNS